MEPLDDSGAFFERLVEQKWLTVARQAWKQYQQRGRGVVVFSLRSPGEDREEPMRYMTFSGEEEEIRNSSMAVMYRLVQEYDPEQEAVVAAILPNDHTVFDVYSLDPAPAKS